MVNSLTDFDTLLCMVEVCETKEQYEKVISYVEFNITVFTNFKNRIIEKIDSLPHGTKDLNKRING